MEKIFDKLRNAFAISDKQGNLGHMIGFYDNPKSQKEYRFEGRHIRGVYKLHSSSEGFNWYCFQGCFKKIK